MVERPLGNGPLDRSPMTWDQLSDPHQWLVLVGFGLAWLLLTGLAVSVGLLLAAWRGAFR